MPARSRFLSFAALGYVWLGLGIAAAQAEESKPIRLLVRADDLGNAQGTNEACIRGFREGIVRSVEVIVPGQWTPDAVKLIVESPGLDVGVHLCVTSEWERTKWRPLTSAPSLVDEYGYFPPQGRQPKGSTPRVGFLDSDYDLREVERELRAQIELLRKMLEQGGRSSACLTHVSAHMGAVNGAPDVRALTMRLEQEYGLRSTDRGGLPDLFGPKVLSANFPQTAQRLAQQFKNPAQREAALLEVLEGLAPGDYLWITHPALDTPEIRNFRNPDLESVAQSRFADFKCLTSARVKEVIKRRGIQLISYADLGPPAAPARNP